MSIITTACYDELPDNTILWGPSKFADSMNYRVLIFIADLCGIAKISEIGAKWLPGRSRYTMNGLVPRLSSSVKIQYRWFLIRQYDILWTTFCLLEVPPFSWQCWNPLQGCFIMSSSSLILCITVRIPQKIINCISMDSFTINETSIISISYASLRL